MRNYFSPLCKNRAKKREEFTILMQKKFEDNYHQKAVTRNENTYILVFQLLSQMDLVYLTVGIKYLSKHLIQSTTHFMKFLLFSIKFGNCIICTEDERSMSVFLLYWQLSLGRMADFPAFIASNFFDL